jgi:hypothetical protein
MEYINKHSHRFEQIENTVKKSGKYRTEIIVTSYAQFIHTFGDTIFTNLNSKNIATQAYKDKHKCEDCGGPAEEGCHGIGEERPILITKALVNCCPVLPCKIWLEDIVVEYVRLHKSTQYALKCKLCHKNESKTKAELKKECDEKGISYNSRTTKAVLVDLLEKSKNTVKPPAKISLKPMHVAQ